MKDNWLTKYRAAMRAFDRLEKRLSEMQYVPFDSLHERLTEIEQRMRQLKIKTQIAKLPWESLEFQWKPKHILEARTLEARQ